ncbi:hypothetical protein ILUMI_06081 [Ignelater luminosus]|uniref:Uncharacterized protein n=1 Tax=Ignelater luminosus TaxID=2038154 RepID=A0A8K0GI31_IGNLU|nr:hypothetical protein ILUMI_06081 [Ignelater luminosus]
MLRTNSTRANPVLVSICCHRHLSAKVLKGGVAAKRLLLQSVKKRGFGEISGRKNDTSQTVKPKGGLVILTKESYKVLEQHVVPFGKRLIDTECTTVRQRSETRLQALP